MYDVLSEAVGLMDPTLYAGYTFQFLGTAPDGDPAKELRVPCLRTARMSRREGEPAGPTLDGLVEGMLAYLEAREPGAEWGAVTFKRPGLPPSSLHVTPRTSALPPARH